MGIFLVSLAVVTGLAAIILAEPLIRVILLLICAAYFGYLSSKIALAKSKIAFIKISNPGFFIAVTFQFINPKAYAIHTTFFSDFEFYPDNFLLEVTLNMISMNFIWISSHLIWLYAGVKLNKLNLPAKAQNQINIFMAVCLIFVVMISVWSVLSP